jgi:cytochrome c biogenesis protein ResB
LTDQGAFRQAWRFLTRLKLAAVLIVILLVLSALGSCFPQASAPVTDDAQRSADWEAGVQARYGSLTNGLAAIGMFRWFRSPVFLVSLGLLAVATSVCTLDRWRRVWSRAFPPSEIPSAMAFKAAPHMAALAGLPVADLPHLLRNYLEDRGFRVHSNIPEGDVLFLRGDRNRMASLATLVTHVAVLLLLLGTLLSSGFGWREELTIEPDGAAGLKHESRWALRNEGFAVARYPDGSISAYQAQVAVVESGQEKVRGSVGVNQPLAYAGVGYYLRGYAEREGGQAVTLLAVRDPGYPLVILAGFLLLLGLTVSLYFPRGWIQARVEPGGTLKLAGWAQRRACDFGREFTKLVQEMEGWKIGKLEDPKTATSATSLNLESCEAPRTAAPSS